MTTQTTLRADSQTVSIAADARRVFTFVADPANLPRWAIGFAAAVRPAGDRCWIVTTPNGAEVACEILADAGCGTVDFHLEPAPGVAAVAYIRVIPNGGGAEVLFTQLQPDGMDDAVFDAQVDAVHHELVALKAVMEVACPN